MTPEQLYWLVIGLFFVLPGLLLVLVVWWMSRNDVAVRFSRQQEGAYLSMDFRGRVKRGRLYRMTDIMGNFPLEYDRFQWTEAGMVKNWWSFWGKPRPFQKRRKFTLCVDWDDVKDYVILAESMPIVGIKRILNLKVEGSAYVPWLPQSGLSGQYVVTNTMMVRAREQFSKLYEYTKNPLTKNEMILKLVLPLAIIVLALAVYILFPKVYTVIMGSAPETLGKAKEGIWEYLKQSAQGQPVG